MSHGTLRGTRGKSSPHQFDSANVHEVGQEPRVPNVDGLRDDGAQTVLFCVCEESNASIVLVALSDKTCEIARHLTVAKRFAKDEREESTVAVSGSDSLRIVGNPLVDLSRFDMICRTAPEIFDDAVKPSDDIAFVPVMFLAVGQDIVGNGLETNGGRTQV